MCRLHVGLRSIIFFKCKERITNMIFLFYILLKKDVEQKNQVITTIFMGMVVKMSLIIPDYKSFI